MTNATFALWGIGGAALTRVILTFIKKVWLDAKGEPVIKDRAAVIAAVVVGIVLSTAAALGQLYPAVQTVLDVLGAGVLSGLTACGLYAVTKKR